VLDVDGPTPRPGAELLLDGTVVGRVTSAAGPVALAYLKRSVTPPATVVAGDSGATATVRPA
jgi:hypothetical protein